MKNLKKSEELRQSGILDVVADIEKVKSELDWRPQIDFEHGILGCLRTEIRDRE